MTRERAIIIITSKIGVVIIVAVRIGRSKKLENPFLLLLGRFFFFFVAPHCLRNDSRPPVASIVFSVDRNTPHALPIFSTNYCSDESFSPLLCRPIGARSMRKKIITQLESVCADRSASQITIAGFERWRWTWKNPRTQCCESFRWERMFGNLRGKFNVLIDLARV